MVYKWNPVSNVWIIIISIPESEIKGFVSIGMTMEFVEKMCTPNSRDDRYFMGKKIQHIDDFIFCVALLVFRFVLGN